MEEFRTGPSPAIIPVASENSEDDSSCGPLMIDEPILDELIAEESPSIIVSSNKNSLASTPTNFNSGFHLNGAEPPVMLHDPNLPDGWSRLVHQRTMGASAGKYDVYIYSPDKKKIRSKTDLTSYLQKNNITDLDPETFDFTVRGKGNTPPKPPSKSGRSRSKPRPSTKSPLASSVKPAEKLTDTLTNGITKNQSANKSASGPSMIVKFEFPVARIKRPLTASKSKTKKPKISEGTDSVTSDDEAPMTSAMGECQQAVASPSDGDSDAGPPLL